MCTLICVVHSSQQQQKRQQPLQHPLLYILKIKKKKKSEIFQLIHIHIVHVQISKFRVCDSLTAAHSTRVYVYIIYTSIYILTKRILINVMYAAVSCRYIYINLSNKKDMKREKSCIVEMRPLLKCLSVCVLYHLVVCM